MGYIEFADVYKRYKSGSETVNALDGVSFSIEQGELCVVVGPVSYTHLTLPTRSTV